MSIRNNRIDRPVDKGRNDVDADILSYDIGFKPVVNLLVPTISSVIHHLCPKITMLPLIMNDATESRQIKKLYDRLQRKWNSKKENKWKSVKKICKSIKEAISKEDVDDSSKNTVHSRLEITKMNLELASIQRISEKKKSFDVIESSKHWITLQSYFNVVSATTDPHTTKQIQTPPIGNRNILLRLFINLIIIAFRNGDYLKSQCLITQKLFQSTHFRDIFEDNLQCTTWDEIISFWSDSKVHDLNSKENRMEMVDFLKLYPSMMTLFILYIIIVLKSDQITNLETLSTVKRIIDKIESDHHHQLPPSLSILHILKALCLMVKGQWKASLSVLDQYPSQSEYHPFSVYLRGWICHRIGDYKECKKYLMECTKDLHFEQIKCINLFVAMRHASSSKQLNKATKALEKVLCDGTAEEKSLSTYNWIQLHMASSEGQKKEWTEDTIGCLLEAIKLETNRSLFWEKGFGIHTEITRHRMAQITFRVFLKLRYFKSGKRFYMMLIRYLSNCDTTLDDNEMQILYREFCCSLIGLREWSTICQFVDTANRDDIHLRVLYVEALLQQKRTEIDHVMTEIDRIRDRYAYSLGISWWCWMFSGRCYEMNDDLEDALKCYVMAVEEEPQCLLTTWYRVNVMRKMKGKSSSREMVVIWLTFIGIAVDEGIGFYQELLNDGDGMEMYLEKKIASFVQFGESHQLMENGDNLIFSFLFELPVYQLSRVSLTEMTRFCIREWVCHCERVS